jgi:hypothetical protein
VIYLQGRCRLTSFAFFLYSCARVLPSLLIPYGLSRRKMTGPLRNSLANRLDGLRKAGLAVADEKELVP